MEKRTYIIAEIGTAHQGSLGKAEKLIKAAARSGADCAKFQVVFADEIIHKNTGTVPLPGGDIPLYQVFRDLEQDRDFYRNLKEMTEAEGMDFLASPFGLKSAALLRDIGSDQFKIASPELNHYPLLKEVASYNKDMILSSGVSTLGDIEEALKITGTERTTLLHCITAYPAPPEEYNLKLIPLLAQLFGVQTGVSDHSTDPVLVPLLSVAVGGRMIEKHFTLSRMTDGLDDPIALEPEDFRKMADSVREAEARGIESIIPTLTKKYGETLVNAVLGSGRKVLAPSERNNYERTNRSVHAAEELKAGTVLTRQNCALLRTEKVLRPGISPLYWEEILGRTVKCPVPDGEGIRWEDLL